jgi:hypothetical protein
MIFFTIIWIPIIFIASLLVSLSIIGPNAAFPFSRSATSTTFLPDWATDHATSLALSRASVTLTKSELTMIEVIMTHYDSSTRFGSWFGSISRLPFTLKQ